MGDGLRTDVARHHILGMRDAPEIPSRQALRHGEREHHLTLVVGTQLRIEESGLGKVTPNGLAVAIRLLSLFIFNHFLLISGFRRISHLSHLCIFLCHGIGDTSYAGSHSFRHRRYSPALKQYHAIHIVEPHPRHIQVVEAPARHLIVFLFPVERPVSGLVVAGATACGIEPTAEIQVQILVTAVNLVERSVIEICQHFSGCRRSLGSLDDQLPFFLLSGLQFVTEHFPLDIEGSLWL